MIMVLPELTPNVACHVVNMVLTPDRMNKLGLHYELNPIENHGIEIVLKTAPVHVRLNELEYIRSLIKNLNIAALEVFDFIEQQTSR